MSNTSTKVVVPQHTLPEYREVVTFLRGMGDRPSKIRDFLVARDIQGLRHEPVACPIAMAIRREFGQRHIWLHVQVGSTVILQNQKQGSMRVPLPNPVFRFVTGFDNNHYPELLQR